MTIEMTKEEKAAIARLLAGAMADDDKPAISALAKVFAAMNAKPETRPAPKPQPSWEPPHSC